MFTNFFDFDQKILKKNENKTMKKEYIANFVNKTKFIISNKISIIRKFI